MQAHRAGFRFGDRLITIGEQAVVNVSHADAVQMLQFDGEQPVIIQVGRLPLEDEEGEHIIEVSFKRLPGKPIGVSIIGGSDEPVAEGDTAIYTSTVVEGGAAALDGRLQPLDKLLVCNGQNLANVTHAVAVQIIQSNPDSVNLLISRVIEDGSRAGDDSNGADTDAFA
jgi:C-terminal processing protease CtpA/Prc